jgi:hypothetical protein
VRWCGAVLLLAVGCTGSSEDASSEQAAPPVSALSTGAPVTPIRHSYFPRRNDVDFWETVPKTHVEPLFFLQVQPRIQTPAEGPWIATFSDRDGRVLARIPGLRVDVATGNFLFLCARDRFAPGDWTLTLEVVEGGLAGREPRQVFRFRVE